MTKIKKDAMNLKDGVEVYIGESEGGRGRKNVVITLSSQK